MTRFSWSYNHTKDWSQGCHTFSGSITAETISGALGGICGDVTAGSDWAKDENGNSIAVPENGEIIAGNRQITEQEAEAMAMELLK